MYEASTLEKNNFYSGHVRAREDGLLHWLTEGFKRAIGDRAWAKHQELQRAKTAKIGALPAHYSIKSQATLGLNDKST
jgi:hypothetical protein